MNHNKYFAADTGEKAVSYLALKSSEWFRSFSNVNYLDKIKRSFDAYHGNFYEDSHAINFGGEQGELVNLAINHYRNIANHMINMVTSTRPAFQCRAVNSDSVSQIQASLGNGILDYYMRERRLERYLKKATEYAVVLSAGYLKVEWDSTSGEMVDVLEPDPDLIFSFNEDGEPLDEEGNVIHNIPIFQGDVAFKVLSPFDVLFDSTKENYDDNEWVLCRSFVNRFDLVAQYPELEDEILKIDTKDKHLGARLLASGPYDETEDIPVYEFYHKKTAAVPEGRYIMYVSDNAVLEDTALPYRDIPLYRISASDILGTAFAYTNLFDLLPIQDAINTLYSTTFTNQSTFGVQNIISPIGSNVKMNQLSSGLNHIEYNVIQGAPGGGAPQALNLTNTPSEIFNFLQMLERAMETISGINHVVRGNADQASNLRSGNALALLQSQALQFISGLQQSYIQLIEDAGTGLINLLKDFAHAPRVAAIAGINNSTKLKSFKSSDLKQINTVVVDVGNALTQTSAGRLEIANNLLQQGLIRSPEKYIQVLTTGNLDTLIENEMDETILIKDENERMLLGEDVVAISFDAHNFHIREHRAILQSQELRRDPELVQRVLAHIQEHIELLKTTDPDLLMIINEQPIQQQPPAQPGMENPDLMANPEAQSVAVMDQVENLPEPAGLPADAQPGPTTPQEAMANQMTGR